MPPEVVIFVGLQASGKTTFYRTRFAMTHVHISKDNFRNASNRERRQQRLLSEALMAAESVVVDNTNATRVQRAPVIGLAREFGATVTGYSFESSVAASLERNSRREGIARVPDVAIYSTVAVLTPPEYEEGFDQLYTVRALEEGEFEVEALPR